SLWSGPLWSGPLWSGPLWSWWSAWSSCSAGWVCSVTACWLPMSSRGVAPVDHELGAGGEADLVAGEEGDHGGDLLGPAEPRHRSGADEHVAVGVAQDRGVDVARVHGVDPHPLRRPAEGGGLGEQAHGALGGVVGGADAR